MKISLLINMKMPTIVGIFVFISRENFMLSLVEHEKSFITLGPGQTVSIWFCLRCFWSCHCILDISLSMSDVFSYVSENRFWHFMQIISKENLFSWKRKYLRELVCEFYPECVNALCLHFTVLLRANLMKQINCWIVLTRYRKKKKNYFSDLGAPFKKLTYLT